jgi:hypothetical protein
MLKGFGWIVVALGMTVLGTAGASRGVGRAAPPQVNDAPIGTCIYECDATGQTYRTRAQCTASCAGSVCVPIC